MNDAMLADLHALDVATLLGRLSPGATLTLSPGEHVLLERLVRAGLVARAADRGASRAAMDAKKDALARASDPAEVTRLRLEILELSESLASADGAASVQASTGDGPYRAGGGSEASYALTQAGRALLSNLGPRAERAPTLPLSEFGRQLAALERLFGARARRAAEMTARVQARAAGSIPLHALRSAMLGLATLPEPGDALADAFFVLFTAIRQVYVARPCTPAQDASAAESLILHAGRASAAYAADAAPTFVLARDAIGVRFCEGRSEDALDAMLLLAAFPTGQHEARIERAARFATEMAQRGARTPLSVALLVTAGDEGSARVSGIADAYDALRTTTADPIEALTAAALVGAQDARAVPAQLERVRALHAYLSRIAPEGMLVGAALLGLLDGEPAGLLDDLRLAGKHVQEQRLAPGGAEATSLALKMLLHSALLARGTEGDPEESLALALRALPDVAVLDVGTQGLGAMSATLPLLTSSVVTFHRPMLDAAVVYEQHSRPMHSDYVFGGGGVWRTGGSSSTYHHASHRSHRSFGWG